MQPGDERQGDYSRERLIAMDRRFVERVERAFEMGKENRQAAVATIDARSRLRHAAGGSKTSPPSSTRRGLAARPRHVSRPGATPCTSTASKLSDRAIEGMPVRPRMVSGRLISLRNRPSPLPERDL